MSEEILNIPVNIFIETLKRSGLIDKMYDAIKENDLSDAVMTALDILNEAKLMPMIQKSVKSESKSKELRLAGNNAYKNGVYSDALKFFNKALLYAPTNSESMVLAYSNRSALLFKMNAIRPCLSDIETCFSIGCSMEITKKLSDRKEKCNSFLFESACKSAALISSFGVEYFQFNEKRNKDIPWASSDVKVVMEKGFPKIVAAKNIDCGKIVAIEPAFVADLCAENCLTSCYNCHKISFNLIPCDGCCYALFCNDNCRNKCMNKYHKIECQIIDVIENFISNAKRFDSKCRLPIKAALKIREMSQSWSDFISASSKIGARRMEQSSINEIFDVSNKLSILNFHDRNNFVVGKIFNQSFIYAVILKYLSDIPEYFPQNLDKRDEAMRAVARIMLSLHVSFPLELEIQNAAQNHQIRAVTSEPESNMGLFSFASKLPHNCEPNLLYVGLNNKLALIAMRSIKKGTELTISYLRHWCEINYEDTRETVLFLNAEWKCRCRVCVEKWSSFNTNPAHLTPDLIQCVQKWHLVQRNPYLVDYKIKFRETCYALEKFHAIPHTIQYLEIFREFLKILTICQYAATQNDTL